MGKSWRLLLAVLALAAFMTGCSTSSSYTPLHHEIQIAPSSTFKVGEVNDKSGFIFEAGDEDSFNLAQAMKENLVSVLTINNSFNADGPYTINVDILEYSPGNAGLRWLMPGLGATSLSIKSIVCSNKDVPLAEIPVKRSIAAGGAYTVGAYKYVFREVAEEIVKILLDENKCKPPKSKNKGK
jgi:hypothetical protein